MVNRRPFEGPGSSDGVDDKSAVVAEEEMFRLLKVLIDLLLLLDFLKY
eukprot:SAG11_NODE_341_length_10462_cov_49.272990_15_plen_48_part_00